MGPAPHWFCHWFQGQLHALKLLVLYRGSQLRVAGPRYSSVAIVVLSCRPLHDIVQPCGRVQLGVRLLSEEKKTWKETEDRHERCCLPRRIKAILATATEKCICAACWGSKEGGVGKLPPWKERNSWRCSGLRRLVPAQRLVWWAEGSREASAEYFDWCSPHRSWHLANCWHCSKHSTTTCMYVEPRSSRPSMSCTARSGCGRILNAPLLSSHRTTRPGADTRRFAMCVATRVRWQWRLSCWRDTRPCILSAARVGAGDAWRGPAARRRGEAKAWWLIQYKRRKRTCETNMYHMWPN